MKEWKDSTTYSRGKERIPSVWAYKNDQIRISILNKHKYYPNKWVLNCFTLNIEGHVLNIPFDTPIEEVQKVALKLIKTKLQRIIQSLN